MEQELTNALQIILREASGLASVAATTQPHSAHSGHLATDSEHTLSNPNSNPDFKQTPPTQTEPPASPSQPDQPQDLHSPSSSDGVPSPHPPEPDPHEALQDQTETAREHAPLSLREDGSAAITTTPQDFDPEPHAPQQSSLQVSPASAEVDNISQGVHTTTMLDQEDIPEELPTWDIPVGLSGVAEGTMVALREAVDLFKLEGLCEAHEGTAVARCIEKHCAAYSDETVKCIDTTLRSIAALSASQKDATETYDALSQQIRVALNCLKCHENKIFDFRESGSLLLERQEVYSYVNVSLHSSGLMKQKLSAMRSEAEAVEMQKKRGISALRDAAILQEAQCVQAEEHRRQLTLCHTEVTTEINTTTARTQQQQHRHTHAASILNEMQAKGATLISNLCHTIEQELNTMKTRAKRIQEETRLAHQCATQLRTTADGFSVFERLHKKQCLAADAVVAAAKSSFDTLTSCEVLSTKGCEVIVTRGSLYEALDTTLHKFRSFSGNLYDFLARHSVRLKGERALLKLPPYDSDGDNGEEDPDVEDIVCTKQQRKQQRRNSALLKQLVTGTRPADALLHDTSRKHVTRRKRKSPPPESTTPPEGSPLDAEERRLEDRIHTICTKKYFLTEEQAEEEEEHSTLPSPTAPSDTSEERDAAQRLSAVLKRLERRDEDREAFENRSVDGNLEVTPGQEHLYSPEGSVVSEVNEEEGEAERKEMTRLEADIAKVTELMTTLETDVGEDDLIHTAARTEAREQELGHHHTVDMLPLESIIDDERNSIALARDQLETTRKKGLRVAYHSIPADLVVRRFKHPKTNSVLPVLPLDYSSRIDETICFMKADGSSAPYRLDAVNRVHADSQRNESSCHDALLSSTEKDKPGHAFSSLRLHATPLITVETTPQTEYDPKDAALCRDTELAFFRELHSKSETWPEDRIREQERARLLAKIPENNVISQGVADFFAGASEENVATKEDMEKTAEITPEEAVLKAKTEAEDAFEDFDDVKREEAAAEEARLRRAMLAATSDEKNLEPCTREKTILPISYKAKREEWRRLRSELDIRRHTPAEAIPLRKRLEDMDMADLTGISYIQLMRRKFDYGTPEKDVDALLEHAEMKHIETNKETKPVHSTPRLWNGEVFSCPDDIERVTVTARSYRVLQKHYAIPDPRVRSGIGKIINEVNRAVAAGIKEVALSLPIAAFAPDLKSVMRYTYLLDLIPTEWTTECVAITVKIND